MPGRLLDAVDAAWARGLGCDVGVLRTPGAHMVAGSPELAGYQAIYMVRIDGSVLVYCPEFLRPKVLALLDGTPADEVFSVSTLKATAADHLDVVRGPAWHGFVDGDHFVPDPGPGRGAVGGR